MSDAVVRGVVHLIEETKTYGENGFRKRLLVLEQDNGRFTNFIPLDFIQDACDTVDEVKKGDEVYYGKYSGTEVEMSGDKYVILRESDLLAVVEK